jgi:Zn-dependent protease
MLRAWKVCRAFGIDVYIHWSFFLLPLLMLWMNPEITEQGVGPALFYTGLLFSVFFCVLLHEFGHALMARAFGIGTQDITLYPIGGVARLQRMSENPWEELLIAVAGPLVNVVIAGALGCMLFLAGVLTMTGAILPVEGAGHLLLQFLVYLMLTNIGLVLFNMIPAFPMDGGRVLRALLSMGLGHLTATRIAVAVSTVALLALGFVGIMWVRNPMMLIVLPVLFFAGQAELRMAEYNAWRRRQARRRAEEEGEFVEPVDPVPLAAPALPDLVLRPTIHVYTWDHEHGVWVRDPAKPGSVGVN